MNFVAIDVETAQSAPWSICQIGLAIVEQGELKQTLTFLVQPPDNFYMFWNSRVHGIIPFMTRNSPFFPEVWQKIRPLLEGRMLVAHNAAFDKDSLKQALEYYQLDVPAFEFKCTYRMTGLGLDRASAGLGIQLDNHHDAGCDAEACALIYLKLLAGHVPDPPPKKKTRKALNSFRGHERLSGDILTPLEKVDDPTNPFCGQKVLFTGVLESLSRKEAATMVHQMGAHICCDITPQIDMVISGARPGPVKMEKICNYNEQGSTIRIISEEEFLEMTQRLAD